MTCNKKEIVYVLSNEGMPNLIKIGKTQRKDIQMNRPLHKITAAFFALLAACGCQHACPNTQKPLKVLMVGNSFSLSVI